MKFLVILLSMMASVQAFQGNMIEHYMMMVSYKYAFLDASPSPYLDLITYGFGNCGDNIDTTNLVEKYRLNVSDHLKPHHHLHTCKFIKEKYKKLSIEMRCLKNQFKDLLLLNMQEFISERIVNEINLGTPMSEEVMNEIKAFLVKIKVPIIELPLEQGMLATDWLEKLFLPLGITEIKYISKALTRYLLRQSRDKLNWLQAYHIANNCFQVTGIHLSDRMKRLIFFQFARKYSIINSETAFDFINEIFSGCEVEDLIPSKNTLEFHYELDENVCLTLKALFVEIEYRESSYGYLRSQWNHITADLVQEMFNLDAYNVRTKLNEILFPTQIYSDEYQSTEEIVYFLRNTFLILEGDEIDAIMDLLEEHIRSVNKWKQAHSVVSNCFPLMEKSFSNLMLRFVLQDSITIYDVTNDNLENRKYVEYQNIVLIVEHIFGECFNNIIDDSYQTISVVNFMPHIYENEVSHKDMCQIIKRLAELVLLYDPYCNCMRKKFVKEVAHKVKQIITEETDPENVSHNMRNIIDALNIQFPTENLGIEVENSDLDEKLKRQINEKTNVKLNEVIHNLKNEIIEKEKKQKAKRNSFGQIQKKMSEAQYIVKSACNF